MTKKVEFPPIPPLPNKVDIKKELSAMTDYVAENWVGASKEDIQVFMDTTWSKLDKKHPYPINTNLLSTHFDTHELALKRMDIEYRQSMDPKATEQTIFGGLQKDKIYQFYHTSGLVSLDLERVVREVTQGNYYFDEVTQLSKEVKKEVPQTSRLKPKNWNKLKDEDNIDILESAYDENKFKGTPFSGNFAPFSYESGVSSVRYWHYQHNIPPFEALIRAVLAHFGRVMERNNAIDVIKELKEFSNHYEKVEYYKNPPTVLDWEFKHPLTKAYAALCNADMSKDQRMEEAKTILEEATKIHAQNQQTSTRKKRI